jgi:hypothetical protein
VASYGGARRSEEDAGEVSGGAVEVEVRLPVRHTVTWRSSWTRRRFQKVTGEGGPRGGAHGRKRTTARSASSDSLRKLFLDEGSAVLHAERRWVRRPATEHAEHGRRLTVEGDSSAGLAVELDNGHSNTFSGGPGEVTGTKDFGQDFGRRSSDNCRLELYTGARDRWEKMRGGGRATWAPGRDGVPTRGP